MKDRTPVDARTCALLVAMYALLIANFTVFWTAPLPLPVHVLVSALAIHLSFTVWHEAVHRNASRVPAINDAVGILGALPYMAPYYIEKWFHLQHHALLNRPDDPNRIYTDGPFWTVPLRYPRVLRYARGRMVDDPRQPREKLLDRLPVLAAIAVYGAAWWAGVLLDVLLLWLVPLALSKLVMDWYINYLPHVGLPPERFGGTRIVDVPWLTPLVLCHNYHAIHHLWPNLPWYRYPAVFREKREWLRERGVPVERRLLGVRLQPHELARQDSLPG